MQDQEFLFLYGNYTGDIMTFDMASDLCDMDDIECKSIVGADDVNSHADPDTRRGVAGDLFYVQGSWGEELMKAERLKK